MKDDERPGLGDGSDTQTRLMTRRLTRSDSSPVLVIPVASPRYLTPVPIDVLPAETSPRARARARRVSVGRVVLAMMALIVIGACGASVHARRAASPRRANDGEAVNAVVQPAHVASDDVAVARH